MLEQVVQARARCETLDSMPLQRTLTAFQGLHATPDGGEGSHPATHRKALGSNAHAVTQQRAGAPRADPRHRFSIALGARDAYKHLLPPQVTACVVVLDPPAPVAVRVIV